MFPYTVGVHGFAFISYRLGIYSLSMTAVIHLFGSGSVVGATLFASFCTHVFSSGALAGVNASHMSSD